MPRTLGARLVVAWLAGLVVTLTAAGVLLLGLFRTSVERRFDRALADHVEELAAAGDVEQGRFVLSWRPADPRFERPLSGWYWQVERAGEVQARSSSLVGLSLEVPDGDQEIHRWIGPQGVALRAFARSIRFPGDEQPYEVIVAGPEADVAADVRRFGVALASTLGGLALGLAGMLALQLRFGLAPLRRLRAALADVRSGRAARLPTDFPAEIAGLVSEANALLDYNATLLERARGQVGSLAHALKTPLAVLANQAAALDGETGVAVRRQVGAMADNVERHLAKARMAGSANLLGARAEVAPLVEGLASAMRVLHRERDLDLAVSGGLEGLVFRGDEQDLQEMLGNLMDNACKWARSRVSVAGRSEGDRLHLAVEDDGPGVPPEQRQEALARGRRLDQTVPGSGLGLSIVVEIAGLYGGRLTLDTSTLGGLAARLELPAATPG